MNPSPKGIERGEGQSGAEGESKLEREGGREGGKEG